MKPCTKDRITSPGSWYCSDYAIGFIAGWGAHPLDISIWGIDYDQARPVQDPWHRHRRNAGRACSTRSPPGM
jgi:hypothetical protein